MKPVEGGRRLRVLENLRLAGNIGRGSDCHRLGNVYVSSEVAMFDRVTFDPKVMGGRACIRGMRVPVSVIVSQIAHGASFDEILAGYPDLEREDIQQAIEYAAWLAQERVENA